MFTDETKTTEAELDNEATEEESEDVETESSEEAPADDTSSSSDPLDTMDDAQLRAFALGIGRSPDQALSGEDLLADVKKHRAIHQRREKKDTDPTPTNNSEAFTKSDFESAREKEAKQSLAETEDPTLADIRENWTQIAEYYVPRSGRDTVAGILKDMRVARAAYREANPGSDPEKEAIRNASQVAGTGGKTSKPAEPAKKRIIPQKKGIDNWYGKGA